MVVCCPFTDAVSVPLLSASVDSINHVMDIDFRLDHLTRAPGALGEICGIIKSISCLQRVGSCQVLISFLKDLKRSSLLL